MLAVAVVAGLLGWYVPPGHRQFDAVSAIRAAGGSVEYAPPRGLARCLPDWLISGLGRDFFVNVSGVRFDGGATIVELRRYESISPEELTHALERLADLPGLESIDLGLMLPLTDDDLRHFGQSPDLKSLTIYAPQLTDRGLAHLAGLRQLQELHLDYTSATQAGIDRLRQALPDCRIEW